MNIIKYNQNNQIKEFSVAKAWSKCESSFCVDPARIDILSILDGVSEGRQSTFCNSREKAIALLCDEANAYVNPRGGGGIDVQQGEDQQSTFHSLPERSPIILGGPVNYAAPRSPCLSTGFATSYKSNYAVKMIYLN